MKLAILHYHLNRGGVTRVIENQLLALDAVLPAGETWPVALIYGGGREDWPEDLPQRLQSIRLSLHVLPELEYDEIRTDDDPQSDTLDEPLLNLLDELQFAPRETVLHVHNHALGKNVALPPAICLLAERGYALLLEPHDFAEDFREENFRALAQALAEQSPGGSWHGWLYPQAPHVHYAVLNGRDQRILRAAGVDPTCLHLLPNPVPASGRLPPAGEIRGRLAEEFAVGREDRFVLYPVRGIRRKNLGEALLYSELAPPQTVIGLTLPPLNPVEQPSYEQWKQLAAELELPCRFELGAPGGLGFTENLAAADLILTTSLAEGFGMVFLEAWLAGRRLVGRDLPEITADFTQAGVRLDGLRARLEIPLELIGNHAFRQTVLDAYRLTLAAYDRPQPLNLSDGLDAKVQRGRVDFADLDRTLQQQVIRGVCQDREVRRQVLRSNPWIYRAFTVGPNEASELIEENARVIGRYFSLRPSGRRLLELYQRVAGSPRAGAIRPLARADRILNAFLELSRFRPTGIQ